MSVISRAPKRALPIDVVRHVLWHFGDVNFGTEPGSFVTRLLVAMSAADGENRRRLGLGFPEYVAAFEMVQLRSWGLDYLRGLAKSDLDGSLRRHVEVTLDLAGRDI